MIWNGNRVAEDSSLERAPDKAPGARVTITAVRCRRLHCFWGVFSPCEQNQKWQAMKY